MNDELESRSEAGRERQTTRKERLSGALRANLKRRRAQARARRATDPAPSEDADESG